ncbi:hypothetical protein BDZ91DRAFT_732734 [Kalaharituber pfeilii]|nr:hypothetical protein BDZ91DRAFT_732734 [Kalaharituber pfeilii]
MPLTQSLSEIKGREANGLDPSPISGLQSWVAHLQQGFIPFVLQLVLYFLLILSILVAFSFAIECMISIKGLCVFREADKALRMHRGPSQASRSTQGMKASTIQIRKRFCYDTHDRPNRIRELDSGMSRTNATEALVKHENSAIDAGHLHSSVKLFTHAAERRVGRKASLAPLRNLEESYLWPVPESNKHCAKIDNDKMWEIPANLDTPAPCLNSRFTAGDCVLRIRPKSTILKGTCDEEDIYDGPWEVIDVHIQIVRKSSRPRFTARLRIPEDSLLFRKGGGWVAQDQLIKTKLLRDYDEPSVVVHGVTLYAVHKVRGMRLEKKFSANSKHFNADVKQRIKYLVHWAGYPSEDDSWEEAVSDRVADGIPRQFIEEWKRREREWRSTPQRLR